MTKNILFLFCLLAMSGEVLFAQSERIYVAQGCNYDGEPHCFDEECNVFGFSSTGEAEQVVNTILAEIGSNLKQAKFDIRSASVPNAEAVVDNGRRLILYSPDFILRVKSMGDWAATSVLAHEIAHHILGHTLSSEGSRPTEELDADEWSGFIMCKLGASLDEAQIAIRTIAKEKPTLGTHPPRKARLDAIANGFAKAKCSVGGNPTPPTPKPVVVVDANEANYQAFKQQGDAAYNNGKWRLAKSNYAEALNYKANDSYCKSRLAECEQKIQIADEKAAEEEKRALYAQYKKEGDNYFAKSEWEKAKAAYKNALLYAAGDGYCVQKISECGEKLVEKPKVEVNPVQPEKKKDQPDFVTMKHIQGGTFTMGDRFGEGESGETQHQVTLSNYWLGATEVTQDEWKSIMGNNPSDFKCGSCPVELVSWNDVQEFLKKLNQRYPGRNYRLPTEAEWEYAARERGQKVRFGNGKDILNPSEANFDASESYKKPYSVAGEYRGRTTAVKTFLPNSLGLYDMAGNVWEWCSDWYGAYPSSAQTNPIGADSGSNRVIRGGCWSRRPQNLRCAYRSYDSPGIRSFNIGFRLSRTE